jgi:hypothetical protein
MRKCKTPLPPRVLQLLKGCLDKVVEAIKLRGEVTDAELTEMGVPMTNSKHKDSLAISRRRSIVLTHPAHVERSTAKRLSAKVKKRYSEPAKPVMALPIAEAATPAAEEVTAPENASNKRKSKPNSKYT